MTVTTPTLPPHQKPARLLGMTDCSDQSDEGHLLCPSTTAAPVASTAAPCSSYQHRCANAECVFNWDGDVSCKL